MEARGRGIKVLVGLRVVDLLLVEGLDLAFGPGMALLAGETGAGKSILIDALCAALGGRAPSSWVRPGAGRALVEARFAHLAEQGPWLEALEASGVAQAVAGELVLSRELSTKGSRCRIDGQLVPQSALRAVGRALVEVVAQHEHQLLVDATAHLHWLDAFAGAGPQRALVSAAAESLSQARHRLHEAEAKARHDENERDFRAFQLAELEEAQLHSPDELTKLDEERRRLAHAEELRTGALSAHEALWDCDKALVDQAGSWAAKVGRWANLDPALQGAAESLASAQNFLGEAARDLRRYAEGFTHEGGRLNELESRSDRLRDLLRKHGPDLPAAMAKRDLLRRQLAEAHAQEDALGLLVQATERALATWVVAAGKLSALREAATQALALAVEQELAALALERARFEVRLSPRHAEGHPEGAEEAAFWVTMNPGAPAGALAKTASGGELSRVLLALQAALAAKAATPVLVFDEIDVGISGLAAAAVAERLGRLSQAKQVLAISHLPAVAAMADAHYLVEKRVEGSKTLMVVGPVQGAERVAALARMAGGEATAAAKAHASELLARAEAFKSKAAKPNKAKPLVKAGGKR